MNDVVQTKASQRRVKKFGAVVLKEEKNTDTNMEIYSFNAKQCGNYFSDGRSFGFPVKRILAGKGKIFRDKKQRRQF